MRLIPLGLILSFLGTPALANPSERLSPQSVAQRLEGLLVYKASGDFEIHMSSCRVGWRSAAQQADDASVYLYQEQARDDRLDQPYRQRLLKISAAASESAAPAVVTSDSFRLAEAERWTGLCRGQERDRTFTQSDILPAHCRVTLKQKGKKFIGATPEPGCPSQYRGATYVRNQIILTRKGMKTFDQGVDAQGNRVWGSDGKPYRFRKQALPE
ncbi:MAG: chromophore lyase CpcT/CpeT [Cyanobacteria bacterium P01_F01_bin.42]